MAMNNDKLERQDAVLDRVKVRKWNRFVWSGLVIVAIGVILVMYGFDLNTGVNTFSSESLLIGIGAIIALIGIIRILIGIINPSIPADTRAMIEPKPDKVVTLDDLFKHEDET